MFDKRLKKLRLEQGWKQKDLAEKLGMATSTIGMYERGLRQPDTDTLTKFSILFNVSSDYLLGISDKRDHSDLTEKDKKDISRTLDTLMEQIENNENEPLNYNGQEVDPEDMELLKDAIGIALKRIKKKNKEKYTPNKYKE